MRIEPGNIFKIRSATRSDMTRCGTILNDWIDETPWMPRVHSHQDVVRYHTDFVHKNRDVLVAERNDSDVQGFAATSSDAVVTGFYLAQDARRKGLGRQMLNQIKQAYPSGLSLWTFVANTGARKFYEREGFSEERRTDGDNEENLPDILYRWQPEGAAA
ncbi:GNAT family N-acetyltransferase [Roseibium sp.]|uniref:GNAT family N-acetyltransferase n=1 Tax=Roseibium sp. TaxID=1936156 RepID=UPI003BAD6965